MSIKADSNSLRQLPLFRNCDPVPLQVMAFAAEKVDFAANEDIISQGDEATAMHLVLNGKAELLDGDTVIGKAEAGYLLGEVSMLRGGTYAITARAKEAAQTLVIKQALFARVVREYPGFGQKVMENLGDRVGQNMRELEAVRAKMLAAGDLADLK